MRKTVMWQLKYLAKQIKDEIKNGKCDQRKTIVLLVYLYKLIIIIRYIDLKN